MADSGKRVAVVLFNLGGPDGRDAVRPFLFNLFNDPAIISAPGPVRWFLAQMISRRRAPLAQENYAIMGGGSPLLPNTEKQARALETALADSGEVRCFIAMRYWHPFAAEAARDVKAFDPDQIVLLPLYPQFAAATTGSSLDDWRRAAARAGLDAPTSTICCYPEEDGFIQSMGRLAAEGWQKAARAGEPRILFSAHGLPKREIERGDPYQWQVQKTAAAIAAVVSQKLGREPEWKISYQSRVGPLEWIAPYTDAEIEQAGRENRPLVVVPLAFVSEHVETLVELDVEYGHLAREKGVPAYERVSTAGDDGQFIGGLANMVRRVLADPGNVSCGYTGRICPEDRSRCRCGGA